MPTGLCRRPAGCTQSGVALVVADAARSSPWHLADWRDESPRRLRIPEKSGFTRARPQRPPPERVRGGWLPDRRWAGLRSRLLRGGGGRLEACCQDRRLLGVVLGGGGGRGLGP